MRERKAQLLDLWREVWPLLIMIGIGYVVWLLVQLAK